MGDDGLGIDEVWQVIDEQRLSLADFLDGLTEEEWAVRSLCTAWRVRDVAAHLTLAHMGTLHALGSTLRAGSMTRMIRDTAIRQARLPTGSLAPLLRSMAGSRRTAPGVTPLEPLIDVLVHGQDIALPLGRTRSVPVPAAATAASRAWRNRWPFRTRRRFGDLRFAATDCGWAEGEGPLVEGPVRAILLTLTGRSALLGELSGPGAALVAQRLQGARDGTPRDVGKVRR
jgi:uncharacterized protein (TIGR03083 family)